MKITFVIFPPNLSGGNRVIAIYADKLRKRGHEVDCVIPALYLGWREVLQTKLLGRCLSMGNGRNHFDHLGVPYRVAQTPRDVPDADVVISTWWETAEYVETLPDRCGRKAYFVQHHEVFDYLPVDRVRATYRFDQKKIVVASWLRDLMEEAYGDPDTSLVSNSVDLELFRSAPRDKQPRTTIGYMHSSADFKNVGLALEALEIARSRLPELEVRAFGQEAPGSPEGPPDYVDYRWKPPQEELRTVYGHCDAWLFTSRIEGFGLPILEAMACRTPVIAVPEGAAPDFIDDRVSGFLVPHDAGALADAIVEVDQMSNASWRAMSQAAFERVREQSWDRATECFEAVLLELLDDPRRAPSRRRSSSPKLTRSTGVARRGVQRVAAFARRRSSGS
jgi:glycosyltransferase involved in cell wall biosynthesis